MEDKSAFKLKGLRLLMTDGSIVEDPILYCHSETTSIGGTTYYLHKRDVAADGTATTLTADGATVGVRVWGKFVFQLTGVAKILASTINAVYRVSVSSTSVVMNGQVDIIIRQNDDVIRSTIASNTSATSNTSSGTWVTLTGANYSFVEYTVVDQTDWLEVDYKCNVTTKKAGASTYLRIDDNTLATSNQTRTTGWDFQANYTRTMKEVPVFVDKMAKAPIRTYQRSLKDILVTTDVPTKTLVEFAMIHTRSIIDAFMFVDSLRKESAHTYQRSLREPQPLVEKLARYAVYIYEKTLIDVLSKIDALTKAAQKIHIQQLCETLPYLERIAHETALLYSQSFKNVLTLTDWVNRTAVVSYSQTLSEPTVWTDILTRYVAYSYQKTLIDPFSLIDLSSQSMRLAYSRIIRDALTFTDRIAKQPMLTYQRSIIEALEIIDRLTKTTAEEVPSVSASRKVTLVKYI